MLRKIENIAASSEFKNNSRFSSNVGNASGAVHRKTGASDSFSFSNAFKFLASLKWNLKNLRRNNKEEYEIEFAIDEYEIHTTINPQELYSKFTLYKIFKLFPEGANKSLYEIWLKFIYNPDYTSDENEYFRIEYLQLLTEKVKKFSGLLSGNNNIGTNSILLEGIDSQLNDELCYIHTNLLHFLEKASGETIINYVQKAEHPGTNSLIVEYLNVNN